MRIDLNADLGEGAATDEALLEVITSANVACGGHAGDDATMRRTVSLAAARGVGIGAHPSYPDREGFGRRVVPMSRSTLIESLAAQVSRLAAIARDGGAALQHVKAHGALYNVAVEDGDAASAIAEAVRMVDAGLILVALSGSRMASVFRAQGFSVGEEAFVDRGYTSAGTLVPRSHPAALITDAAAAAARAVRIVQDGMVTSAEGTEIHVRAHTLCVHADTPGSARIAAAARKALEAAGVQVVRMGA